MEVFISVSTLQAYNTNKQRKQREASSIPQVGSGVVADMKTKAKVSKKRDKYKLRHTTDIAKETDKNRSILFQGAVLERTKLKTWGLFNLFALLVLVFNLLILRI